jgi:hypothetical protein
VDKLFGDIARFSFIRACEEVLREQKTEQLIISLNTHSQLYDEGIDSEGRALSSIGGDYSPFTLEAAQRKGKPKQSASIINLNDTGAFYESFNVKINYPNITIQADDSSRYDVPLSESWGKNIVGLTPDNLAKVEEYLATRILEKFYAIFS